MDSWMLPHTHIWLCLNQKFQVVQNKECLYSSGLRNRMMFVYVTAYHIQDGLSKRTQATRRI